MYNKLRAGDTPIIMSIDRLVRDYDAIGRTWKRLTNTKKVNIKVLDMPILNNTNNTLVVEPLMAKATRFLGTPFY